MSAFPVADTLVVVVVGARFLVPLLIPAYPLPGALASLLLDAGDQALLRALLGADLPRYQPYDKALDVYSLSIMMLAVLRNWQHRTAIGIARFLFYVRLAGVLSFELTGWRPLLVIFPNTFEYFFIFYEVVRAWWSPARLGARALVSTALAIWVVIKLPQEYLLHVARIGLSDAIREHVLRVPAATGWAELAAQLLSVLLPAVAALFLALMVRSLARPPDHALRLAADPLPGSIDEPREWAHHVATRWRVLDRQLLEKTVLAGSLTVIFAQIVPGMHSRPVQLVGGVALVAIVNSVLLVRRTRKGRPVLTPVLSFLLMAITNAGFVLAGNAILGGRAGSMSAPALAFAILLVSLVLTTYDRWHPVFDARFGNPAAVE